MTYIPNWQYKNLKCYFCGETRSVKYIIDINDPIINNKCTEVFCCNKCALMRATNIK